MKYLLESRYYYKVGDLVIIEYWYDDRLTQVMIKEILGRKYKVTHDVEGSKIKNAPDEIIKSSDIIDKVKI